MLRPLTLVMTSPGLRPAFSPGLCGSTALISAPCGVLRPKVCASCWPMSCTDTPIRLRATLPVFMS